MSYHIAHAVRGRLRIRYPARWFKDRREALESHLRGIHGVRTVVGSPVTGSVRIEYDPFTLAEQALIDKLHAMGAGIAGTPLHRATAAGSRTRIDSPRAPLLSLIGSSAVLAATFLPVPGPALVGLILASDIPGLLRAAAALGRRRLDGDVLEASTLALLITRRSYVASALLTWLRSVGEYIVAKTVVTTGRSLYELVAESDQHVVRIKEGSREPVPVASLEVGDIIVLDAGRQVPADGTIVAGEALVNQQTVTGEALPVERRPGDPVFAATVIEHGLLEVRVDRVGLDTVVGRIVRTIETAAAEKSDIQLFAERVADREVARTLVLAALGAGFSRNLEAGTAILVADYGLAARVGIPTAIVTSIQRASELGILIKGPKALENLARVNTVVFDKTGTLTSGTPRVTRVVSYARTLTEDQLVRMAAAAESGFRHPVARAIL
ncbi:MAG: hypothetical protein C5B48_05140, partial [Candidatus Rokuibacteriota bacterium]